MADALASGASGGNIMEVQVLSTAPSKIFLFYFAVVAELADALLCGGSVHKTYGFKSRRPHHLLKAAPGAVFIKLHIMRLWRNWQTR